jgi:leader peptidase (prepilin peptidase)/N-methyltransferase
MQLILAIFLFFLGAIFASFTGVVSERIYTGQSWFKGRSRCNSCRRTLGAPDLVPVLSWLFYRGRCRTCKARVPVQYALFEAILGLLFVLSYITFGLTLQLALFLLVLVLLTFIVYYDLRHTIVPWGSSLLLMALSIVFILLRVSDLRSLKWIFLTAVLVGLAFFCLYFFSKGRAMGLGDAPVAFSLSVLVGSAAVPGLLFSFWIGAVIGILILVLRRGGPKMGIEVPFVPFLALGYLLAFFTQWNPLH